MARGFTVLDSTGRLKKVVTSAGQTTVTTTAGGTQNDIAFGLGGDGLIRCNNTIVDLTITGISAGIDGQRITIVSVGTKDVYLAHQSGSSLAANRLTNMVTSGNTPLAAGFGVATYVYDAVSSTWRLISHDQGARLSWTPTYTGSASMTFTGVSTTTAKYYLKGRIALITYDFTGTVGGTPDLQVQASLPNGWQSPSGAFNAYNLNSAGIMSVMQSRSANVNLQFYSTAAATANWGAGSQHILGTVETEIS